MIDLLAARGSVEILIFLNTHNESIPILEINNYFQSEGRELRLTSATVYRRVKELQLAGFIEKNKTNEVSLSKFGREKLIDIQGKEIRLKRSRREILNVIQEEEGISVNELQQRGFSPTTIKQSIDDLAQLDLIKQYVEKTMSLGSKRVGRPKKRHQLTKKGLKALKKQEELEEELKK
ncbi:MAG: winged helix-turn-helix transcriptional regulator [Candidatus Hodarchaeales archaeon]